MGKGSEITEQVGRNVVEKQRSDDIGIVVSPSRFSPLMGIEEEEVEGGNDEESEGAEKEVNDVEEGEITGETGHSSRIASGAKDCSIKGPEVCWPTGNIQKNFR